MTDTTNGWPDKPGVPLNPDRDGDHWLKSASTGETYLFKWKAEKFWSCGQPQILPHWVNHPMWQVKEMTYLGPCLTPDQATALQARVAELEAALQRIASAGGLFSEPASGQHAREIARAALEGGKDE